MRIVSPSLTRRERPARGRLGRHLADDDALVHQAGQLPVGDHRDLAGQPGPVEREHEPGGHAHAGRAGDALAAQHHDLPGVDEAGLEPVE